MVEQDLAVDEMARGDEASLFRRASWGW